ncbi:DamX protein [Alteromonadaceae bacterium 2753L.S.0a.02]|nr:DamX protein [Alteromonadaceae bacterium 2753L.S.0a.02]
MADSDNPNNSYRDAEIHLHDCGVEEVAFFNTPERAGLIEQLQHLVQFGEGLPVIVGDTGMGKSTLLRHLANQLEQVDFCAHIELSGYTRIAQALAAVLTAFKVVPKSGAGELLAQVRHFAQQLASEQLKAVLLLDNAHNLDDAALGAVISLLQGNDSSGYGLQLVFSSKPGLVNRMDALQLIDIPVYDFALPALTAAQLADFLMSARFGGASATLLNKSDITRLWGQTLGNPGASLRLAQKRDKRDTVSLGLPALAFLKGVPLGHVIAMVLLVSVLVWAILVRDKGAGSNTVTIPVAAIGDAQPTTQPRPRDAPISNRDSAANSEQIFKESTGINPSKERVSNSLDKSLTIAPVTDIQPLAASPLPAITSIPVPTPTTTPTPAPTPISAPPIVLATQEPTKAPAGAITSQAGSSELNDDEAFLMSRGDKEFTLQVLAASQKPALQSYVMRQANRKDLYIYQVERNGRRLFVVVAGIYDSKDTALLARESLPAEQRKGGPWPRSMLDVKREIAENRGF